ncbi:hypothetical protein RvY_07511 [Ramazzottius varieornatus]|uniref:HTH CENPB-type domain-containing protein n=1 Tax=Ramazzottius varieornatus TaxID=947166 RepID=A0A1D1V2P5_RAMVA|nr:hypothetical protein RvY_07511 [Ramazzottius varieornatus]
MSLVLKNKKVRDYDDRSLELAIASVKDGMSRSAAAEIYDIPRKTLYRYLINPHRSKMGRGTKYSPEEMKGLAQVLIQFAKTGLPLNKDNLRDHLQHFALEKGMKPSFTNWWHRKFLKEHPEISRRLTSNVDRTKAREWDKEKAEAYIALLSEHHAAGYLTEPEGIFNLDESGLILGYERDRVHTEVGVKQARAHTEGTTRDQVTVLFCGDATGRMLRPLVLYDGKVQLESMHRGTDDKLYVAVNDSGTMDADVLTDYFRKEVIPNMTAQKNIVFMDGHHSHVLNVQLFTLCEKSEKDIQLVCLPSGQTHHLQPLDCCVFSGVKSDWTHYKNLRRVDPDFEISRRTFSGHMALLCTPLAHKFSFDFESVKAGFRKTGIFPFDPEAIRQTVDKTPTRNDQQQNPLLDKHHQSLQTIAVILRKGLNFDSEKVESCLDSIVNVGTGHRTVAESTFWKKAISRDTAPFLQNDVDVPNSAAMFEGNIDTVRKTELSSWQFAERAKSIDAGNALAMESSLKNKDVLAS